MRHCRQLFPSKGGQIRANQIDTQSSLVRKRQMVFNRIREVTWMYEKHAFMFAIELGRDWAVHPCLKVFREKALPTRNEVMCLRVVGELLKLHRSHGAILV